MEASKSKPTRDYRSLAKIIISDLLPSLRYVGGMFIVNDFIYTGNSLINRIEHVNDIVLTQNMRDVHSLTECLIDELAYRYPNERTHWPLSYRAILAKSEGPLPPEKWKQGITFHDKQLLSIVNAVLYYPWETQKFFVLSGAGGSGKSTFMEILGHLVDDSIARFTNENISSFDLQTNLQARVVYADDCGGNGFPISPFDLKSIVTHCSVKTNPKNQTMFEIPTPQTMLFFLTNNQLTFDINDTGLLRRIVYVPFDKSQVIREPNYNYIEGLTEDYYNVLARVALNEEFDFLKNHNKFFFVSTFQGLCKINSVWHYLDNTIYNADYKGYQSYMMNEGRKSVYSKPNYDELAKMYDEWKSKAEQLSGGESGEEEEYPF